MIAVRIARWEAWSPGITNADAWRAWVREPGALARDGRPDVEFLPPLQRRRCDQLTRMMLEVAQRCCGEHEPAALASVFASRHGPFATMTGLLGDLARGEPLSPAKFSHSVHNTPLGIFSIYTGNRLPSNSVAGGADTFAYGFLEAVGMLRRESGRPVLLVVGDEPVPAELLSLAPESHGAYALALLLEPGEEVTFALTQVNEDDARRQWPDALEFLRWWLSGDAEFSIRRSLRQWTWRRDPG
jgi:hypothetical protein